MSNIAKSELYSFSSFSYNSTRTKDLSNFDRLIGSLTVKYEGNIRSIVSYPIYLSNLSTFNQIVNLSNQALTSSTKTQSNIDNLSNIDNSSNIDNLSNVDISNLGKITLRAATKKGFFSEITFGEYDSLTIAKQVISEYIKYELNRTSISYIMYDSENPAKGGMLIVDQDFEQIMKLQLNNNDVYLFGQIIDDFYMCILNNEESTLKSESKSNHHKLEYYDDILYIEDFQNNSKISVINKEYVLNLAKKITTIIPKKLNFSNN